MSGKRNHLRQEKGALRILEALSGVEEELLERSGAPVAEGELIDEDSTLAQEVYSAEAVPQREKMTHTSQYLERHRKIYRYGRLGAACLGLAVVGALSWNGLRMIWGGAGAAGGTTGSASSGGTETNGAPADSSAADAAMGEWTENENTSESDAGMSGAAAEGVESGAGVNADLGAEMESAGSIKDIQEQQADVETVENTSRFSEVRLDSEAKARELMPLGAYLPKDLPQGYSFETARLYGQEQLTVTWTRGSDLMLITVSKVAPETVETVAVDQPETYDMRLYEVPYGESVPEKYRETFLNPVFAAGDLSLEVVSSRMISYDDTGDTDTPRGSFSVFYPEEGILLYLSGRGTPEEIWDMFH